MSLPFCPYAGGGLSDAPVRARTYTPTVSAEESLRRFRSGSDAEPMQWVCWVAIEPVCFLPAGEPAHLPLGGYVRARLRRRYAELIQHRATLAPFFRGRPDLMAALNSLDVFDADGAQPLSTQQVAGLETLLEHVVHRTPSYSRAVWAALTDEQRAARLAGYSVKLPGGAGNTSQTLPLTACVVNRVLAYVGQMLVMPWAMAEPSAP